MNPDDWKKFWGNATWSLIHIFAIIFDNSNSTSYKQFIYSLPGVLPCAKCRKHLEQNLITLPLDSNRLENSQTLFLWTFLLHDLVNHQLEPKKNSPSFQNAYEYYRRMAVNGQWLESFWHVLHSFASSYSPEFKQYFKQFIYSLIGVLPKEFSDKFMHLLKIVPLKDQYLYSNSELFLWTYLIHDYYIKSNKQSNKKQIIFEDLRKFYFNDSCKTCKI